MLGLLLDSPSELPWQCIGKYSQYICRCVQEIHLDKHIKLLDSPGVVMATDTGDTGSMILRNCVKVCSFLPCCDWLVTVLLLLLLCSWNLSVILWLQSRLFSDAATSFRWAHTTIGIVSILLSVPISLLLPPPSRTLFLCPQVLRHYCIPEFKDVQEFLSHLAHKTGKLKKGERVEKKLWVWKYSSAALQLSSKSYSCMIAL